MTGAFAIRKLSPRAVFAVLLLATAPACAKLSIGVLAFRGDAAALSRWSATAEYLGEAIPGETFRIVPLDLDGMSAAVAAGSLDFVLTNTGHYVVLESRYGVSRLATLKVHHQGRDHTRFGAVIFSRRDNDAVHDLSDLAGKSFMAVSRDAFGGFQMAWREMREYGVDPFRDLASLRFNGFPQDAIVYAVLAGEVDAGTVRAGTLDRMAADGLVSPGRFRVINARSDPGFPFAHSTRLYPEWPFAKTRDTPEALAQKVAIALLSMPLDHDAALSAGVGWTIPLDYGSVHELFRELEIGPYAELARPGLDRVWREYRGWILTGAGTLLTMGLLALLTGRANRRIKQSEARLRQEVEQRRRTEQLLAAHRDTLERRVSERTAALALANDSLRRSESTLRRVHEITAAPRLTLETQTEQLLTEGCRYYRMSCGCLIIAPQDGEPTLVRSISRDGLPEPGLSRQLITYALDRIDTGSPVLAATDIAVDGGTETTGALLATCVRREGDTTTLLAFASPQPQEESFSDVDVDILLLMAGWLDSALEKREISLRSEEHRYQLAHVTRLGAMGEMAAGIAHELNQPLTAIVNYANGCARLIQRGPEAAKDLAEAVNRIGSDALRAAEIIRRLRDFLRQGEQRMELISLGACVDVALEMLDDQLGRRSIRVTRHAGQGGDLVQADRIQADRIQADRIQVEQVIINLLLNAMDALADNPPASRQIQIWLSSSSGELTLDVIDNGPGISVEESKRIFEPFYTSKSGGMGMGLSISRTIAEAHGGKLAADRTKDNRTRVRLSLPAAQDLTPAMSA